MLETTAQVQTNKHKKGTNKHKLTQVQKQTSPVLVQTFIEKVKFEHC